MKKVNYYTFAVLYVVIFLMILYRIFTVPIVHDEPATIVHYFNFSVWQIMMYPDSWPNNHILNTLLTKLFIVLFGKEQWIVRFPNLLSFILYAVAVFRINKTVFKETSVFFLPAAILFIANPYFNDFFGLCRGYGMSCAIATLSVSYLITGYYNSNSKHIWTSLLLSILASYANFTLLIFWAATVMLVWFYFFSKSTQQLLKILKPTIVIGAISVFYLALIANPIIKMQSNNQFQYWTSHGFYTDTLVSLIDFSRYGPKTRYFLGNHVIAFIVLSIVAVNCILVFIAFKKSKYKISSLNQPMFIATAVLLLSAFINIMQCYLLKTPNLSGRTSVFFYMLFIIAFVSFLGLFSLIKSKIIQIIVSVLISFICLFHLATRFNSQIPPDFWLDAYNLKVLEYLEKKHTDRKIILKTNWVFHPSLNFYSYTGKTPWLELLEYDKEIDLNTSAEYYYIFSSDYKILETKFEIEYKFSDDRWLVKRSLNPLP